MITFQEIPLSTLLIPDQSYPDTNGWKGRHLRACRIQPVAIMISAAHEYAEKHLDRYESPLSRDYVLGPAFLDMLKGLRVLLNGDCGALDCGTADYAIYRVAEVAGFDLDTGKGLDNA